MFVYILYSEKRSRYYVGQTANIEERLKRHNKGVVKSTKTGAPWKLVLQLEVLNRSEALILEKKIKKRGAKRYIDDHFGLYHAKLGRSSPVIAPRLGRGGRHAEGVTTQKN